jgi:hypothetical protein
MNSHRVPRGKSWSVLLQSPDRGGSSRSRSSLACAHGPATSLRCYGIAQSGCAPPCGGVVTRRRPHATDGRGAKQRLQLVRARLVPVRLAGTGQCRPGTGHEAGVVGLIADLAAPCRFVGLASRGPRSQAFQFEQVRHRSGARKDHRLGRRSGAMTTPTRKPRNPLANDRRTCCVPAELVAAAPGARRDVRAASYADRGDSW